MAPILAPLWLDLQPPPLDLPPPGQAHLHLAVFIGHRLLSQTNTSLFCTLCPHSSGPGCHSLDPLSLLLDPPPSLLDLPPQQLDPPS
uniref:Uncharacterized protein n=1 Tax=Oryza glumipatula TaxID=40148 RepID=A0A0D9YYT5_9ORYZ